MLVLEYFNKTGGGGWKAPAVSRNKKCVVYEKPNILVSESGGGGARGLIYQRGQPLRGYATDALQYVQLSPVAWTSYRTSPGTGAMRTREKFNALCTLFFFFFLHSTVGR